MTNEPALTNGAMVDERAKKVEAGLAMHVRVQGELDEARFEISELRQQLAQDAVAMEGMRSLVNLLESRVQGCVAERDEAVTRYAKLDSLFSMIFATMREFQVVAVPLIRELEDKHAN